MTTVRHALDELTSRLAAAGIGTPRLDADLLVADALDVDKVFLRLAPGRVLTAAERSRIEEAAERRLRRTPMAQIRGFAEFWSLRFEVTADVLTPRPETEGIVQETCERLRAAGVDRAVVVDVGTGTGCVAVALAHELPAATVHAIDISAEALVVARRNAEANGVADRVHLHLGSLLAPVTGTLAPGSVHAVVSNPPYVRRSEIDQLDPEVLHEPAVAVFCEGEPATLYRRIAEDAAPLVAPGGLLVLELPEDPAGAIRAAIDALTAWTVETVVPDLAGIPRILVALRAAPPDRGRLARVAPVRRG